MQHKQNLAAKGWLVWQRGLISAALLALASIHSQIASADVFFNNTQLQALTGSSNSVVPGGIREVTLNGNRYLLSREIYIGKPADNIDGHTFSLQWKSAVESGLHPLQRFGDTSAMTAKAQPTLVELVTGLVKDFNGFEETVVEALEAPMAYETDDFLVLGSFPVRTIVRVDSDSVLAQFGAAKGFLTLAEKPPQGNYPTAFWKIRFAANEFTLSSLLGERQGPFDIQDARGTDPVALPRCPGFVRSFSMLEKTDTWDSGVWSYEGDGDPVQCVQHYRTAASRAGFTPSGKLIDDAQYSFRQYTDGTRLLSVLVENVGAEERPLQVTLQLISS